MTGFNVVLALVVTVAVCICFRPRRRTLCCKSLFNQLYAFQLQGLDKLVGLDEQPDPETDPVAIYEKSHGQCGLWRRWHNRRPLMGLAQVRAQIDGAVTPEEMAYIRERVDFLTSASVTAAFWNLLRHRYPQKSAEANRKAIRLYKELAYMVRNIYSDDPNNFCGHRLASVL